MSNYNPVTEEVISALKAAVGESYVYSDPEKLNQYKTDEETDARFHHLPEVVVAPANTEEVAAVMKIANEYVIPVNLEVPVPAFPVEPFRFVAVLFF